MLTTATDSAHDTSAVRAQLHRVAGQLAGIERMLDDDRPCAEVLVQVQAARGGLGAVAKALVAAEARKCTGDLSTEDAERVTRAIDAVLAQA